MEENKNLENLETEEAAVEEAVEEVIEEATEEIAEEVARVVEEAEVVAAEEVVEAEPEKIKTSSKIIAAVSVIIAIAVVAAAMITSTMDFNKYNKMGFINASGMTIQDVLDQQGITLAEFVEEYGLPADMTADTIIEVADYYIPAGKFAELKGMSFDQVKEMLQLSDDVTEETPWGEIQDNMTLVMLMGLTEETLPSFKAQYGLDDSVTIDTLYKDVRQKMAEVELEMRLEQEKAAEEAAKMAEEEAASAESEESDAGEEAVENTQEAEGEESAAE